MRKISFISLITVMSLPAFALGEVHEMYGKEPVPPEIVAQYEKQFGKAEVLNENEEILKTEKVEQAEDAAKTKEVEEVKKVKEIKEVEVKEIKKDEPTEDISETKEYKDFKEPEYETPSNPKARFPHGLEFGVGVSPTSGLNGFIGYNNKKFDSFWAKRFGIRFDFASFSPIKNKLNKEINETVSEEGGIEIDDTLKIDNISLDAKHFGAMIDFYPFGDTWFLGGWRVSGGYFFGKLDLDAGIYGTPDPENGKVKFELNDHKYYYEDETSAKVMADWKYNGPYLGTGFDLGLFWGFKIYFDAGVVFTGETAKFDLNVPETGLKTGDGISVEDNAEVNAQFQIDKQKELDDARKEIKDYPYYPLVKIGFMYRF